VQHIVYGSAGPGLSATGVDSWESKLIIAAHVRESGIPLTVLRPMAFVELMTDKAFYPPVAVWHLMPRLAGAHTPIPWLAVDDLGAIAARAFAEPATFVGADLALATEFCSIDECRQTWRRVTGRPPRHFPMPLWLFERFVGTDLSTMWRWLAACQRSAGRSRTDPGPGARGHDGGAGADRSRTSNLAVTGEAADRMGPRAAVEICRSGRCASGPARR
jgi:uncharacterized protein YbjT (DUF2867 family)